MEREVADDDKLQGTRLAQQLSLFNISSVSEIAEYDDEEHAMPSNLFNNQNRIWDPKFDNMDFRFENENLSLYFQWIKFLFFFFNYL